MNRSVGFAIGLFVAAAPQVASAQNILTNGGFESGLTGWSPYFAPGSSPEAGRYYATGGGVGPVSGLGLLTPNSGTGYAVSDQTGPGAGSLSQSFVLSGAATSATFSFYMYITNYASEFIGPGFDFSDAVTSPNQHARVDLLSGSPADPLALGGDVLFNAFIGGTSFGWTYFSFDLSPYLTSAGTYTIRFAEVDNQLFFNHGIDDVSLDLASTVPEPATLTLFGLGSLGLAAVRRRRAKV